MRSNTLMREAFKEAVNNGSPEATESPLADEVRDSLRAGSGSTRVRTPWRVLRGDADPTTTHKE